MASIEVIDLGRGKPKLLIGRRKYPLVEIDETHYQAIISPRILFRFSFQDLPAPETEKGNIIIEFLPFTKIKEEYLYEARGLSFFEEASIWRDPERGYVYLEKTILPRKYAFEAWMPLDLYTYIVVKISKQLGFEVEVSRDESGVIIEAEKSYPLDTPVRIAILEIKELDKKVGRDLEKIIARISKSTLRILSKNLNVSVDELLNVLGSPDEKLSTLP